jgi:hypothetical protein
MNLHRDLFGWVAPTRSKNSADISHGFIEKHKKTQCTRKGKGGGGNGPSHRVDPPRSFCDKERKRNSRTRIKRHRPQEQGKAVENKVLLRRVDAPMSFCDKDRRKNSRKGIIRNNAQEKGKAESPPCREGGGEEMVLNVASTHKSNCATKTEERTVRK